MVDLHTDPLTPGLKGFDIEKYVSAGTFVMKKNP